MLGEKPCIYKKLRTFIVEFLAFVHEMIGSRDREIHVHYEGSSSHLIQYRFLFPDIFFIHVKSNLSFQFDYNESNILFN